jgi:hypothetical protein
MRLILRLKIQKPVGETHGFPPKHAVSHGFKRAQDTEDYSPDHKVKNISGFQIMFLNFVISHIICTSI